MKQSKKGHLNIEDYKRIGRNALIFLAPALLIFLTSIQNGKTFEESLIVLKLWALNTAIDLTRKLLAGK